MSAEHAEVMKRLLDIQIELKAPKGQFNSFGKYNYRSAEDILEAVKPLCKIHGAVLTITDELVTIGDRYYVKATAALMSVDGGEVYTHAYAREDADRKGMDGSQITGAASSYARKYALNGLFCIDDTKDADADEHTKNQQDTKSGNEPPTDAAVPDEPGNYLIHAKGKLYDGYTIRQIDLANGGRDILLKMCDSSVPVGSPAYEIQQMVVRYLEKQTGAQNDEEPPF